MKKIITILLLLVLTGTLAANNIAISNLSLTDKNTTDHFTMVQFDISWENSWRTSSAPNNWDAAWVFVKYRKAGGEWNHAWLNENGHTTPAGSIIMPGLVDPGSAFNATTNPGLGAFIYRSADGTGTFTNTGVQLRWNYGANGLADADVAEIKVFAIEMVYMPQGAFAAGSGGSEFFKFTLTTINTGIATTAPSGTGSLGGAAGGYPSGQTTPDNADWPNGFNAFYCQKYEISQQQYVDFLNTLTQTQADKRKKTVSSCRYAITGSVAGSYATTNPYVACNYLNWMDGAAYSDWAGLRPMSELEYEKACRGPATPVANEYAWGNTTAIAANNITNPGTASETTSTEGANGVYGYQTNVLCPMRVGVFAKAGTTRAQAGASYYGIMELSGNLYERAVTVGNAYGRAFTGVHGNGLLSTAGNANVAAWPGLTSGEVTDATGSGLRGGDWADDAMIMRASDRILAAMTDTVRTSFFGFRAVRTQPLPALTTTAATAITSNTASSGGNVTSDGGATITARGICWSTTTGPTADLTTKTTETGTTGEFTSNLINLTASTQYYVRAYATNSAGTAYGNEVSFTTRFSCFIAGTKISMADGTHKNIEDIAVGDLVKSINTETMEIMSETVTSTIVNPPAGNLVKITFSNGQTNTNTKEHPYWVVGKGWSCVDPDAYNNSKAMSAGLLTVGDQCLILENGNLVTVTITAIEDQPQLTLQTFNFKVNQTNCYFANGVIVHNKE